MIQRTPQDKVVILDRDGTLVVDHGYLSDPDRLEFLPGAAQGLRWLSAKGYRLVVITNQSGVGRGLFTQEQLAHVHDRLNTMVEKAGARLDGIYFCPHTPDDHCACRKPELALMKLAATDLHFDPRHSVVIGDKESDIEFGRRAGARTIFIASKSPSSYAGDTTHCTAINLLQAAQLIAPEDLGSLPVCPL